MERKHNRPLVLQDRRQKMAEEDLRKEVHPEAVLLRKIKNACRHYLEGNCTNPSSDYWHPLVCQNYISESGRKCGEQCLFRHTEVDSHPQQKCQRKVLEKDLLPDCRIRSNCVAYIRMWSRRNPSRFYGRAQILCIEEQRAFLKKYVSPRKSSGKKVHRKESLSVLHLMSVAPMLQILKTDLRNKP